MKRSLWIVGAVVAVMATWSIGRVQGQMADGKVIFAAAEQSKFTAMPGGGTFTAAIWGDANQGAHGTFTKFVPGYDAGMHTHTNDVWIVGIKKLEVHSCKWSETREPQPRSGARMQPSGVSPGYKWEIRQP